MYIWSLFSFDLFEVFFENNIPTLKFDSYSKLSERGRDSKGSGLLKQSEIASIAAHITPTSGYEVT